jgi:hypothetical protein
LLQVKGKISSTYKKISKLILFYISLEGYTNYETLS